MFKQWISRAGTAQELLRYLWKERLWWMMPFVVTLLLIAALLIFAQTSPVAPFLYTVF